MLKRQLKKYAVYNESLIGDPAVRNWFAKVRYGDTTLMNELKVGHLFDLDVNLLRPVLEQNT